MLAKSRGQTGPAQDHITTEDATAHLKWITGLAVKYFRAHPMDEQTLK